MALQRLTAFFILYLIFGYIPSLGVILRTTEKTVWANEFEPIELTCLIESISTNNPRIEWKKIQNGVPSYVYFQNQISGDLEHRAQLIQPANLLILNTSRADTAEYRCEVAAIDDHKHFDEILISLAVRGELHCLENEGFPASQYRWFHNNEELPQDPKSSPKFINSTYSINADTGGLKFRRMRKEDAGEYYCQAKNEAGHAQCPTQLMEVYDVDIVGIFLKVLAALAGFIIVMVGVSTNFQRRMMVLTMLKQMR
ncbi:unnamed protein product [Coregonus sp. 'balchen']|nr:unnamed protein product [Coregonus sp. 'balchen']